MRTVLHTESSRGLGGQEIRTLHEARWTGERGWRVILACQPDGRLIERARDAGLEAMPLPMSEIPRPGSRDAPTREKRGGGSTCRTVGS